MTIRRIQYLTTIDLASGTRETNIATLPGHIARCSEETINYLESLGFVIRDSKVTNFHLGYLRHHFADIILRAAPVARRVRHLRKIV